MSGTLSIDTLQNGAGASVPVTTVINGSAKAWVYFQGGTNGTTAGAINSAFNVSSVTVIAGNGQYQVNFSTAMPDNKYVSQFTPQSNTIANFDGVTIVGPQTASYCQVVTGKGVGNSGNQAYGVFAVFFA